MSHPSLVFLISFRTGVSFPFAFKCSIMPPHSESSSSSSLSSSSATTPTEHHETRFVLVNPPTIFAEASKNGSNMSHRSSRTVHGKTKEDNDNFVFFDAAAPQPEHQDNNKPALDKKLAFKNKVRAGGGAKGKEGSSDFTRGKSQFARPCTVGWKSQNQPLRKGGGNRTPL
jgi:hypothetical protein